jgi:hypothetical protein
MTRSYWLTRFLILRLLGVVYLVAFLVLVNQVLPLIGRDGLLPAHDYLERLRQHFGSRSAAVLQIPSLFWLGISDRALLVAAWIGVGLAAMVVAGLANVPLMLLLWALYMSFVNVGQDWYGYGWEIQLLETGFLAVFLCPLVDARPFPRLPPPPAVIWLFRWLIVRIMLGAGLIKLRGDRCWRDLTCLYYHYETQPLPNPVSWWLHFRPHWFQKLGVLFNHAAELAAPWLVVWPRVARLAAGVVMLAFQLTLIVSGNLSFLNWLTIVPILACFDDGLLGRVLPAAAGRARGAGRRGGRVVPAAGRSVLRAGRLRRGAQHRAGPEPPVAGAADEHVLRPPRAREHLRCVRLGRPAPSGDRLRGHA